MDVLPRAFFARSTITVARELLGKILVYQGRFGTCPYKARIVETEAYLDDDPASHAFRGKTDRNAPMFGPPGFTYIYFIYGMYHCLNFVTEPEGKAGAVLIRALEPLEGIDQMKDNRSKKQKNIEPRTWSLEQLTNGPGKLCQALGLTKAQNNLDMCASTSPIFLCDNPIFADDNIVISTRIGINDEHNQPWRFYVKGNRWVSKR